MSHSEFPGMPHHGHSHSGSYPPPHRGPSPMPPQGAGAPQAGPSNGGAPDVTGAFEGAQYKIGHRDSNTMLYVRLQAGYEVLGKPGAMVAMDPSVQIKGKIDFSFKKFITGGELAFAHFVGPGEVLMAPEVWGDITQIRLDGSTTWFFGKHSYLASTQGVVTNTKSQSFGKAFFSGHGLFTGQASGVGILFVQSVGAIISRYLQPGEQWVGKCKSTTAGSPVLISVLVNNDHLVAWNCQYRMEKIQAGGIMSTLKTDEGAVCRCVLHPG
ncbi:hypothetical protein AcV5_006971 [Taiwanofungus camphoratus]|nr:hypothetical protein AcV5_006971 [Antrodia cinnamomea]